MATRVAISSFATTSRPRVLRVLRSSPLFSGVASVPLLHQRRCMPEGYTDLSASRWPAPPSADAVFAAMPEAPRPASVDAVETAAAAATPEAPGLAPPSTLARLHRALAASADEPIGPGNTAAASVLAELRSLDCPGDPDAAFLEALAQHRVGDHATAAATAEALLTALPPAVPPLRLLIDASLALDDFSRLSRALDLATSDELRDGVLRYVADLVLAVATSHAHAHGEGDAAKQVLAVLERVLDGFGTDVSRFFLWSLHAAAQAQLRAASELAASPLTPREAVDNEGGPSPNVVRAVAVRIGCVVTYRAVVGSGLAERAAEPAAFDFTASAALFAALSQLGRARDAAAVGDRVAALHRAHGASFPESLGAATALRAVRLKAAEDRARARPVESLPLLASLCEEYGQTSGDPWRVLACALALANRTADAIVAVNRALAVEPSAPMSHLLLAQLHAKLGNTRQAEEAAAACRLSYATALEGVDFGVEGAAPPGTAGSDAESMLPRTEQVRLVTERRAAAIAAAPPGTATVTGWMHAADQDQQLKEQQQVPPGADAEQPAPAAATAATAEGSVMDAAGPVALDAAAEEAAATTASASATPLSPEDVETEDEKAMRVHIARLEASTRYSKLTYTARVKPLPPPRDTPTGGFVPIAAEKQGLLRPQTEEDVRRAHEDKQFWREHNASGDKPTAEPAASAMPGSRK